MKISIQFIVLIVIGIICYSSQKLKQKPKSSAKTDKDINSKQINKTDNNINNTNSINTEFISHQIQAYRYIDLDGISFDLHNLYDKESDYSFNNGKDFFYLNIGDFSVTKCNKDNAYLVYFNRSEPNSTDCNLLTGSNNLLVPLWKVTSKIFYLI